MKFFKDRFNKYTQARNLHNNKGAALMNIAIGFFSLSYITRHWLLLLIMGLSGLFSLLTGMYFFWKNRHLPIYKDKVGGIVHICLGFFVLFIFIFFGYFSPGKLLPPSIYFVILNVISILILFYIGIVMLISKHKKIN